MKMGGLSLLLVSVSGEGLLKSLGQRSKSRPARVDWQGLQRVFWWARPFFPYILRCSQHVWHRIMAHPHHHTFCPHRAHHFTTSDLAKLVARPPYELTESISPLSQSHSIRNHLHDSISVCRALTFLSQSFERCAQGLVQY